MSKFKVGDRIVAYYPYNEKIKGVVVGVYDHVNSLSVQCDGGAGMNFHPKQCRRLVKKKQKIGNVEFVGKPKVTIEMYYDLFEELGKTNVRIDKLEKGMSFIGIGCS